MVVTCLNKQRGTLPKPLYLLTQQILICSELYSGIQSEVHLWEEEYVACQFSRTDQVVPVERSLHSLIFNEFFLTLWWTDGRVVSHQLEQEAAYLHLSTSQSLGLEGRYISALSEPFRGLHIPFLCADSQSHHSCQGIDWPNDDSSSFSTMSDFPSLLSLLVAELLQLPQMLHLLMQPHFHKFQHSLDLTNLYVRKVFSISLERRDV